MKYIVMLGDGMADEPLEQLGGKTPLEYAKTPVLDAYAAQSEIGMVRTIPEGMKPGSDVANLAVLGYLVSLTVEDVGCIVQLSARRLLRHRACRQVYVVFLGEP